MDTERLAERKILVVADDPQQGRELTDILSEEGYEEVRGCSDPPRAPELAGEWGADLVILDLEIRDGDPFEIVRSLRGEEEGEGEGEGEEEEEDEGADEEAPYVMLVVGEHGEEVLRQALEAGVGGLVRKPVSPVDLAFEVRSQLMLRVLSSPDRQPAGGLSDRELERAQIGVLQTLARLVEYRDFKTERHAERVGELSAKIAEELELEPEEVELVRDAAPLHDVGMVVVPDHILLKEGELTEKERKIMMTHAANGARVLAESELPVMRLASVIAHTHHERWDGEGYPRGLEGEQIPLPGRIVAVADTFEAITHDRPFREAESAERALQEIRRERGRQFDPQVVDALLRVKEREPSVVL